MGAEYDAPNEVVSTEARKHSFAYLATGETKDGLNYWR
jgi:hypothetical protein